MSSKSGNSVARNLGLKLKREGFQDRVMTDIALRELRDGIKYPDSAQDVRVIRYDERGRKIKP